ncbi:MAG: DNA polymerase III subunit chi [Betaproteobacteria bacterium]|nr:DNA polymerase III subunit chi [Betaproteobacteria bacterium]
MTEVDFYHDARDKLAAAAQIIAAQCQAGRRILVFATSDEVARRIDRMMWIQPATGFLPHCAADSRWAGETPVVIARNLDDLSHDDVLVNLDGDLPPGFARFARLIEVVGQDEADRAPARARFRFYRDRGYAVTPHDLSRT